MFTKIEAKKNCNLNIDYLECVGNLDFNNPTHLNFSLPLFINSGDEPLLHPLASVIVNELIWVLLSGVGVPYLVEYLHTGYSTVELTS